MLPPCPGDSCPIWSAAAGDYDYKVETKVCEGCKQCGGNPPAEPVESRGTGDESGSEPGAIATGLADDESEDLFQTIENLIEWENGGFTTDWDHYPYEIARLVQIWRNAEKEVATIQTSRLQVFIKSWFKE